MDTNDLLNLIANIKQSFGKDFEENLMKQLALQQSESEDDVINEIAENYRCIAKTLKKNYSCVKLDSEDLSVIMIDGKVYDLDTEFSHNDLKITECRMAIESLTADLSSEGTDMNEIFSKIEDMLK